MERISLSPASLSIPAGAPTVIHGGGDALIADDGGSSYVAFDDSYERTALFATFPPANIPPEARIPGEDVLGVSMRVQYVAQVVTLGTVDSQSIRPEGWHGGEVRQLWGTGDPIFYGTGWQQREAPHESIPVTKEPDWSDDYAWLQEGYQMGVRITLGGGGLHLTWLQLVIMYDLDVAAGLPPLRQFPRDDRLGSAARVWPTSSQQGSLRRHGYF